MTGEEEKASIWTGRHPDQGENGRRIARTPLKRWQFGAEIRDNATRTRFDKANKCFDKANKCFDKSVKCFDKPPKCFDKPPKCFDKPPKCFDKSPKCFVEPADHFGKANGAFETSITPERIHGTESPNHPLSRPTIAPICPPPPQPCP